VPFPASARPTRNFAEAGEICAIPRANPLSGCTRRLDQRQQAGGERDCPPRPTPWLRRSLRCPFHVVPG
jgi:hypothetical protein